jgi:hypothetical protein
VVRNCSVSWSKHLKVETTKTSAYANCKWKMSFVQIQRQNGMSASCSIISQWEGKILILVQGGLWKGKYFLHSKIHFARSYHHTLRKCKKKCHPIQGRLQSIRRPVWNYCKMGIVKTVRLRQMTGMVKKAKLVNMNRD